MRRTLSLVLLTLGVAACQQDAGAPLDPAASAAPVLSLAPNAERVPGQYIVVLNDDASDVRGLARRMAAEHRGTVRYVYEHALKGFSLQMPDAAVQALARNPNVKYVEPNQRMHLTTTQNSAPWGLDRVDQRDRPLSTTYNYSYTGSGVRAYIIDTGVRVSHTDFGGRATDGWDFIDNDAVAQDCHGHGTHVAGTVGGTTYGVAKSVSLVALRVFDCVGDTYNDAVTAAVDWVSNNAVKPAVANMSLGGGASTTLDNAVRSAISSGVVFVLSSGNDNQSACSNVSPARVTEGITVGSTDTYDVEASDSNYGSCLDLFAPGVGITSADKDFDTDTRVRSGTSMAAPHVAGAAALYLQWKPTATPATVQTEIKNAASTNKVTFASGHSGSPNRLLYTQFVGFGATLNGAYTMGHNNTCSWSATVTGGTAPYTYSWSTSVNSSSTGFYVNGGQGTANVTGWAYYYLSYPQSTIVTLTASITDATGLNVVLQRPVTLYNSPLGCY